MESESSGHSAIHYIWLVWNFELLYLTLLRLLPLLFFWTSSIPPLSVVGLSEEQAIEQAKGDIHVYTSSFNPMKNTISGYVSCIFIIIFYEKSIIVDIVQTVAAW